MCDAWNLVALQIHCWGQALVALQKQTAPASDCLGAATASRACFRPFWFCAWLERLNSLQRACSWCNEKRPPEPFWISFFQEKRFQFSRLFSRKIWPLSQAAKHEGSKCSQLIIFRTVTKMDTNTPHTKDTAWVTNKRCKGLFSCDRIRKLPPTTLCTQSFPSDSACSDCREPWYWISGFGPAVSNESQQRR